MGYKFGWRKMQVVCLIIALAIILLFVLPLVIQGFTQASWREFFNQCSLTLMLPPVALAGTVLIPYLRRRTTLFKAALASPLGNVPMAANQPIPDNSPIVSPITIRHRVRWPAALAWHTVFFLVATSVFFGFVLGYEVLKARLEGTTPEEWPFMLWILVFIVLTCGLGTGLGTILLPMQLQTIHITDKGITRVQTGLTSTIAWQDVRVFALVGGSKRHGSPAAYMLNTGKSAVRWTHYSRTLWYSIMAPTTSDEEYQQQMEALLSHVAARTGLPLLDMR